MGVGEEELDVEQRRTPPIAPEDIERVNPTPTLIDHVIPGRNIPALLSWYFGVFALLPVLGIPLGVVAVVLGIIGFFKARNPEVRVGTLHACLGIVLGIAGPSLWIGLMWWQPWMQR